MVRHWSYVVIVAFGLIPQALAADGPLANQLPPAIDLLLKPHQSAGKVDYVDVRMSIEHPAIALGAVLVQMPLVVASIPTARYDGDAIHARDDQGDLALTQKDETPGPFLSPRDWIATRATTGTVVLNFRALPRIITEKTRNGPLFDLREEAGGMEGAGFTFVPVPLAKDPYRLHVHWDLSDMPAGARGVWSLGEGDANTVRPANVLQESFYFAGSVKSYPADGSGKFAMYWLSEPPFDATAVATMIKRLYDYMTAFFHDDPNATYRIFVRHSPVKSGGGGGGTALTRSFMFGYGNLRAPTVDGLEALIAHEMTHNWPSLEGDHADTSWYTEGTAEYYSILLSYRAGLITPQKFLELVNGRAKGYYENPLQTLTNRQAEQIYWKDSRAGHVPYGRGWMYFAGVDAEIRTKSHDKRSLDDLVLAILDRQRHGQSATPDDWRNLVVAELGPDGGTQYDDMVQGKRLTPPANTFGPCFRPETVAEYPDDLGFDASSLDGPHKIVKGVIARSAAATAGLRDGDEIEDAPDVGDPSFRFDQPLTLLVRRGDTVRPVTFIPHGTKVEGYRWVRNPRISDAQCKV
jgi:hypothetical protein